jgi:hypothetical protein
VGALVFLGLIAQKVGWGAVPLCVCVVGIWLAGASLLIDVFELVFHRARRSPLRRTAAKATACAAFYAVCVIAGLGGVALVIGLASVALVTFPLTLIAVETVLQRAAGRRTADEFLRKSAVP